jgi:ribonuclease HI
MNNNRSSNTYDKLITYSDGGARGNPGPAGAGGVVQTPQGEVLAEISEYLGETTNNIAEYKALILTLQQASRFVSKSLEVRADSELMVKQLKGEYKVKNEGLKPLYLQAKDLLLNYKIVSIKHVYRSDNKRADELANEAMDRQESPVSSMDGVEAGGYDANSGDGGSVNDNPADNTPSTKGTGFHEQGTLF